MIPNGQGVGHLSDNLDEAIRIALETGLPQACRERALRFTWGACTRQFVDNMVVHAGTRGAEPVLRYPVPALNGTARMHSS